MGNRRLGFRAKSPGRHSRNAEDMKTAVANPDPAALADIVKAVARPAKPGFNPQRLGL